MGVDSQHIKVKGRHFFIAVKRAICTLCCVLFIAMSANAGSPIEESTLKAALIYKLSKFIQWPEIAHDSTPNSFHICLLKENIFSNTLKELEGYKVKDKVVKVLHFTRSADVSDKCRILLISKSKQAFLDTVLENLKFKPILTLGESDNFANQGGMIQLIEKNKRIEFVINLYRVKQARLSISAPLLELATIVNSSHAKRL